MRNNPCDLEINWYCSQERRWINTGAYGARYNDVEKDILVKNQKVSESTFKLDQPPLPRRAAS